VRKPPDVVCVGILVADAIARPVDELPPRGSLGLVEEVTLRAGGCAVNTASALVRLGSSASVHGKVGTDAFGDFLVGVLADRGVDATGVLRDHTVPTSATVALVDSGGERTFLHLPGANGALHLRDLDPAAVFSGRILHLAGSLVMPALDGEPSASLLRDARSRGMTTSLDTVFDPTGGWERVLPCLPWVDVFAPGLAEGRGITGQDDPAAVAAWLLDRGVGAVALKMGDAGCYAAGEGFTGSIPSHPVRAVDGTGSGDAFSAGLLHGTLAGWPWERSARFANAMGALATTAMGAVEGVRGLEETLAFAGL
jgi:sugar/nucleoside kinase (ribokinase family)